MHDSNEGIQGPIEVMQEPIEVRKYFDWGLPGELPVVYEDDGDEYLHAESIIAIKARPMIMFYLDLPVSAQPAPTDTYSGSRLAFMMCTKKSNTEPKEESGVFGCFNVTNNQITARFPRWPAPMDAFFSELCGTLQVPDREVVCNNVEELLFAIETELVFRMKVARIEAQRSAQRGAQRGAQRETINETLRAGQGNKRKKLY